jgi:hypothetical protein
MLPAICRVTGVDTAKSGVCRSQASSALTVRPTGSTRTTEVCDHSTNVSGRFQPSQGGHDLRWLLVTVAVGVGAALFFRLKTRGGFDIEKMIDRMPEGSPPRWMFENIGAVRANTERIIELLEAERLAP